MRKENKIKLNKKSVCAGMAFTVASAVLAVTLSQTGQPMTVYAKETFRGIDQVVEEHESKPFVILDVVPGDASAKWTDNKGTEHEVSLSMGTIGYLVDGQAPIEQDLLLAFTKEEDKALFYNCENRERLTDVVVPDGFASGNPEDINILYEEAYGGVAGMETDDSWIKLYDPVELPTEDTSDGTAGGASGGTSGSTTGGASGGTSADTPLPALTVDAPTGVFKGVYAKYSEAAGGDKSGYDYKYVSGDNNSPQILDADGNPGGPVYHADDKNGEYRVTFEACGEGVRGYVPVTETTDLSAYSDNTSIYRKENGVYVYYGQIKDVRPSEEQDKVQEIPVDPDNPNGNAGEEDGSDDEAISGNDINKDNSEEPEDSGQADENNNGGAGSSGDSSNGSTGTSSGDSSNGGANGSSGNSSNSSDNTGNDSGTGTGSSSGNNGGANGNSGNSSSDNTGNGGTDAGVSSGNNNNSNNSNDVSTDGSDTTISDNDAPQTSARAAGKSDGWRLLVAEDGDADTGIDTDTDTDTDASTDTDTDTDTSTDTNTDTSTDSNADDEFYVVLFRYEEEPDESQTTYQAGNVYQVADGDQVIRPYDLYSLEQSEDELENSVEMFAIGGNAAEVVFRYVGSGKGDYKLAKADENTSAPHTIKVENAPVYFRCVNSRDWLKQYVFGQKNNSSFGIKVRMKRADQVTAKDVEEADLVFLEAGGTDFLKAGAVTHYITTGDIADMSEDAVLKLLYSVGNEAKPIIVDYDIIADDESEYKDSDYRKMARLFLKNSLSAYMEEMDNDLDDMYMNAEKDIKSDNTFHYVNKNIYVLNESVGGMLVAGDFMKPFDSAAADRGFEEIIAAIEMENMVLPENDKMPLQISKAVAVQYIINYAVGLIGNFERLNILELQPSSNETPDLYFEESSENNGENNSVKLIWKKKDSGLPGQQLLRSNKGIEQKSVTVKSVARFNSEWEDLNSSYDMIFIGLDGQRLNRENRTGYTVYNDESLNKKVYHSGDHASGSDERYDANDITPQKERALIEYLRAGYPVVVEDAFFTDGTAKGAREEDINTDYIDSDTGIYRFLKRVLTDDELLNHKNFYTVSDVWGNAYFTAQINMRKPNLSYSKEQDFVVQTLTREEDGECYGVIEYTVDDGFGDGYVGNTDIRMYIDWNNDGIFSEKEILSSDQYTADGGSVTLALKDVSEGVFMWKLEVYDTGNMYRRDSLEGCFRCVGDTPAKIKILQIVDESDLDNPAVNLQKIFETENNSLLAVTLKNAEGMINASYEIKSVTVSQLLEEMNREQAGEGYLKKWDVIVLGFGAPTDLSGIRDLLVSYAGSGGSMLVSSAAAKTGTGRLGFDASFLGQTERKTYVNLGAASSRYYRYDGLEGEMFEPQTWNIGVSLNKGIISYYPYVIDETIDIVQANRAADYLLDFDGNYSEDGGISDTCVTAWYTFSGSNVNRNAYSVSEKDGRNNYYVYSKGNVVYVGQESYPYIYGETEDWNGDLEGTDECRIFVNALMAAYNSGVHAPDISIVAGFGSNQASIRSITIPFDQDLSDLGDATNGVLDETVDVYFMYMDNNLVFNKSMSLSFFWENDAGMPVDIGGRTIHATEFSSKIWAVENNQLVEVSAGQLEPGTVYKIKAPAVALKENSSITNADIYIVLTTSLYKNDSERSMVNNAFVTLNRAQLFLLE